MAKKYRKFKSAWAKAQAAGRLAAEASVPTPMVVSEADGLSDRPKPGGKSWYVSEGVCGFAWIVVKPGTSSLARWLKKEGLASKHYYGGVSHWISGYGQSMTRKEAHARAMVEVLREELPEYADGIYSGSRMD